MIQHTVAKTAARAAVTGAMIGLWAAAGPIAAQGANESALRAKVTQFIKQTEKEANFPVENAQVSTRFVDLNADRTSEALVVVRDPTWCGSRGCSAYVLDLRGPAARSIGDFIAHKLEALSSRTGGWRDISVNVAESAFVADNTAADTEEPKPEPGPAALLLSRRRTARHANIAS